MDIFISPRQGGKSTHIINWMREAPQGIARVAVCASAQEATRMYRSTWDEDGAPTDLESWQFLSWTEAASPGCLPAVRAAGRFHHLEFAIDNADLILETLLSQAGVVSLATWNVESLKVNEGTIQTAFFPNEQGEIVEFTTHVQEYEDED